MIEIICKPLSVCFNDLKCKSQEEIFPPFRTEEFTEGLTVYGADGKSFFVSKGRAGYTIDGAAKTYEEVLVELPLCLAAIEGNNEVQCFANLAAFPAAGEDCVLYVAEDTGLIYLWNGASYVQLTTGPASVLLTKSGIVAFGSFAPTPTLQKASVVFATAFADNLYSVTITGEDSRAWQIESKLATGFTINSNSAVALTGNTFFQAIKSGETV